MRTTGKQCGLAATGDYQPSLRSPWLAAEVHVPVKHGAQVVIDEDMPSYKGAHLLGHEGELAVEVKYEVRRGDSG